MEGVCNKTKFTFNKRPGAKLNKMTMSELTNLLQKSHNFEKEKRSNNVLNEEFKANFALIPPIAQPNVLLENYSIIEATYGTDLKNGLTRKVAEERQIANGKNVLNLPSSKTFRIFRGGWLSEQTGLLLSKYVEQFMEPLIGLLIISAGISLLLGQVENALSISVAVLIVGTVGFIQEYRTEKSLEALKRLAPPRCKVIRDAGRVWDILANDLVVGDVVELAIGDRIPADMILISTNDLQVDESIITGENGPVKKQSCGQKSKVLMGTLVRQGRARGLVTGIGLNTEFGRLAVMMHETEERRSPLQIRLDHLGSQLTIYSVGIIILISLVGLFFQKRSFIEIFTVAVSLAVAAIPEGLPIVATITLALGVLRLAKRGVVVKKLPAVEALGSMSVLCTDKTGTLTLNQMTVDAIYSTEVDQIIDMKYYRDWWRECPELSKIAWNCNNAVLMSGNQTTKWQGNSTDVALKKWLNNHPNEELNILKSIPFNSTTKMMAVKVKNVFNAEAKEEWLVKGAAEVLLSRAVTGGEDFGKISRALSEFNCKGYRVIALGKGVWNERENYLESVQVIGLIALTDPCRLGMDEMIKSLHSAKIQTIMITGDSKESATSIGIKIGLIRSSWENSSILSGDEMIANLKMTSQQQPGHFRSILNNLKIVYRATPEQKLALVKSLQSIDHVVAMTGDGVNDAPALKLADIGIAMGGSNGSDVAREAANIIMTDDDLFRIIEGIAEGRAIFRNIRHFVRFQLGVSLAALGLMSTTSIFNLPPPLTSLQILLINIIMDGPPAQSLGVEPTTPESIASLLDLAPVDSNVRILSKEMIMQTVLMSCAIITCTLLGYPISKYMKLDTFALLTYATFVSSTLSYALTCRSSSKSVLFSLPTGGPLSNSYLNLSLALTALMLLITCHLELFRGNVQMLKFKAWSLPAASMIFVLVLDELVKVGWKLVVKKRGKRGFELVRQHSSSTEMI